MFTGIIEEKGTVLSFTKGASAWKLRVAANQALEQISLGDSIAVDGCCLTVTDFGSSEIAFDILEETKRLTTLSDVSENDAVNLERSLRFGGKIGGHFVTGHIDGVGEIVAFEQRGADHYLKVRGPVGCGKYVVQKGSIAIDGISLTVAEQDADEFAVWLIPHTLKATGLGAKSTRDKVNLEFDLVGKYVEKLTIPYLPQT